MNLNTRVTVALLTGVAIATSAATAGAADKQYSPGASDTEVRIGHTTAYSGPVSAFGAGGRAYTAYFDMINAGGGINGRKIRFLSLDDAYSPPKAVEQTRKLVENENVLFIVGVSGTPTNTATQKYLNNKGVPQALISTGAGKFNDPAKFPWTMPFWPSYRLEQKTYVDYIFKVRPDAKIGVLYANDDYGKDHLEGIRKAMEAHGKADRLTAQAYETSDAVVDSQILNLKNSGADVFISATTPKFAAQAMRKAHEIGWKPMQFVANAASSVSAVLVPAGVDASTGVITGAFLKSPDDPALAGDPDIKEYLEFMRTRQSQDNPTDFFATVSYMKASVLEHVLRRAGDNLTRENIMKIVGDLHDVKAKMMLPKIVIKTTPDDFEAFKTLQLQRFDGKKWVDLE